MNKHFNNDLDNMRSCHVAAAQSMESLLSLHRHTCATTYKIMNIDVQLSSSFTEITSLLVVTVRLLCLLHIAFQKMTGRNYSIIYTSGITDNKYGTLLPTLLQTTDNSTCQSFIEDITSLLDDLNEESMLCNNVLDNKLFSSNAKIIVAVEGYRNISPQMIDDNSLLFHICRREKRFALCLSYHGEIYKNDFVEAIASGISNIEASAFVDTNILVNDLCLEKDLTRLSGLQAPVINIMQKFHEIPSESEKKIAITQFCQYSFDPLKENNSVKTMTFGELRSLSDYIAAKIIKISKDAEKIISVCVSDRRLLIASILAVIKCGRTFSCIFPLFPDNQKKRILTDNESELLLCDYFFHFDGITTVVVSIDDLASKVSSAPCCLNEMSTAVYAMQTSGTTGTPKRITVKRSNLNNYLSWRVDHYPVSSKDTTLIMLNENSDAFFGSLLPALLVESNIVIGELEEQRNYEIIAKTIADFNVTNFSATPRMLQALLHNGECSQFQSIESIIVGGEPSGPELFDLVYEKCSQKTKLVHEYGLTETTIACCANTDWNHKNVFCIGTPIQNTSIYIVDKDNKPMPAYLPGMIIVEGPCVASIGENDNHADLFNTFDIGYYDKKGFVHFVGRHRNDLKINGVRFNHQEIKLVLLKQPGVNEAVSYVKDYGTQKQIIAYVTGNNTLDMAHLSQMLKEELYLQHIPVTVIQVNKLPTGINEKVEEMAKAHQLEDNNKLPPNSSIENKVQYYWRQALNMQSFSKNKTFFELGGNSILLTKMYKAMQEEQKWEKLRMVDFFKFPTIDSLVSHLKTLGYS